VVFVKFTAASVGSPLRPAVKAHTGHAMQYKGFDICAFRYEPGKWRARIFRTNGKLSNTANRKLQELVTGPDPSSAADALILAMEAIDLLDREISSREPASMPRKRRRQHRRRQNGHFRIRDCLN
jgi:hypothetical protein